MKIIDLTYDLELDMLRFNAPWHCDYDIEQMGIIEKVGRETKKLTLGTHAGTHMDAPLHFIENGKTIPDIKLDRLIGDVTIVDFENLELNQAVTLEMVKKLNITERMIFKFGWGKYWGRDGFYKDYPYFTLEATEYLIKKGLNVIGLDTPSPDNSKTKLLSKEDSIIHKKLLENEIVIVEYLANLDKVDLNLSWELIALPLKIKNGDGAPSRVCLKEVKK